MKNLTAFAAFTTIVLLAGCSFATTEYKSFQGKLDGVIDGSGGTKVVVDDIDIWDDGEPPRKFKILGFIDDTRDNDWLNMFTLNDDVVDEAREAGGNAIIKLNSQSQLARFFAAGGASLNSYAYPVFASNRSRSNHNHISKYAVIKYVDQ